MIIISNNTKTIKISLSGTITENNNHEFKVELPEVICNDKKSAEYIQQQVNTFINELSKELIK